MTTKHTPGPWVVSAGQVFISKAIKGGFKKICKIEPGQEHNATLIAAAPDLLEAVKDMLHDIEIFYAHHREPGNKYLINLKAAVAKAEGR